MREIDKDCKCKFSFTWLDKSVEIKHENGQSTTHKLGEFIEKTDAPGQAVCTLCNNATLQYGGRGIAALTDHCRIKKHVKNVQAKLKTHAINQHFASLAPEPLITVGEDTPTRQPGGGDISATEPTKLPALMCDRVSTAEVNISHIFDIRPKFDK